MVMNCLGKTALGLDSAEPHEHEGLASRKEGIGEETMAEGKAMLAGKVALVTRKGTI